MYVFSGFLLLLCVFFFILFHYRKKRLIQKVCCMTGCEKLHQLNELLSPFGFSYFPSQDIITSNLDAWQREFGYRTLFDRTAPYFNMVFDFEPIYFDYQDHTWLIEFWKGQYGINIGGEIGIYRADRILTCDEYDSAQFHSIPDGQLLPLSMKISFHGCPLFTISRTHWWLTGFCPGKYCEPQDLSMRISITFPDDMMLQSFTESLLKNGYQESELCICGYTISFSFTRPHCKPHSTIRLTARLAARISQWENRLFCLLYCWITRPFTRTADQILYLSYYLPFAFRHMLRFRRPRHQKSARRNRRQKGAHRSQRQKGTRRSQSQKGKRRCRR